MATMAAAASSASTDCSISGTPAMDARMASAANRTQRIGNNGITRASATGLITRSTGTNPKTVTTSRTAIGIGEPGVATTSRAMVTAALYGRSSTEAASDVSAA